MSVIEPCTVLDDEIVPWCCPYECDDGKQNELGTVEFSEKGSSDQVEDCAERDRPYQVKVAVAKSACWPVLVGLEEVRHSRKGCRSAPSEASGD